MADLNFPTNPTLGQEFSIGSRTWVWNGTAWQLQSGIVSTNPFIVVSAQVTTSTQSTSTNSGALIVAGGIGAGGNVNVGGNLTASNITATNNLTVGDSLYNSFTGQALTLGVPITLDAFRTDQFRSAKYLVQIVEKSVTPNMVHCAELLLTHDNNGGTTLGYILQYGIVTNFGELGTWDAVYDVGSTRMLLQFTPTYNPSQMYVTINRHLLTV